MCARAKACWLARQQRLWSALRAVGFGRPVTGGPTGIDLENGRGPEAVWSRRIHADLVNNRTHCPKK